MVNTNLYGVIYRYFATSYYKNFIFLKKQLTFNIHRAKLFIYSKGAVDYKSAAPLFFS